MVLFNTKKGSGIGTSWKKFLEQFRTIFLKCVDISETINSHNICSNVKYKSNVYGMFTEQYCNLTLIFYYATKLLVI